VKSVVRTISIYVFLFVITGLLYPFVITNIGRIFFKEKVKGSIIYRDGRPVASKLIAQPFVSPYLFWGRPSTNNYNPLSSGGSNLGPTNPELYRVVKERIKNLRRSGFDGPVPSYLVFASGSGLDPHLPPYAVYSQVERVSRYTGIPKDLLYRLIEKHTEKRFLGFIGEERVNILELNLELLGLMDKYRKSSSSGM